MLSRLAIHHFEGESEKNEPKYRTVEQVLSIPCFRARVGIEMAIDYDGHPVVPRTRFVCKRQLVLIRCFMGTKSQLSTNHRCNSQTRAAWLLIDSSRVRGILESKSTH